MIKCAWLIFSLLACLLADVAFGQQTVRVIVLPFKIHAQEELSYLQQQIPQAIKTQLEQEGAKVLIIDQESLESRNMQADNLKDIRELSSSNRHGLCCLGKPDLDRSEFQSGCKAALAN